MKVSVALCTYNGAAHLNRQLDSLIQQEHLPSEVIVCDDQSTDETISILESFSKAAPFPVHILVNEQRLGSTRNFEKAMLACTGDAIALCDQDDIWYPQKLRRLRDALKDPSIGGVFSDGDLLSSDRHSSGSLWSSFGIGSAEYAALMHSDGIEVLLRSNKVTGMTLMFRRDLLPRILPIPAHWVHDYWIALLVVIFSRLVPVPERLVAYRSHAGQQLGVPTSFWTALLHNGPKYALGELSRIARRESNSLLEQMNSLSAMLDKNASEPRIASILLRLRRRMQFLNHRSQIQDMMGLERFRAIFANRRLYSEFSPRPVADCLVDLLSVQPRC